MDIQFRNSWHCHMLCGAISLSLLSVGCRSESDTKRPSDSNRLGLLSTKETSAIVIEGLTKWLKAKERIEPKEGVFFICEQNVALEGVEQEGLEDVAVENEDVVQLIRDWRQKGAIRANIGTLLAGQLHDVDVLDAGQVPPDEPQRIDLEGYAMSARSRGVVQWALLAVSQGEYEDCALMYIDWYKGPLVGDGTLIHLRRDKRQSEGWVVVALLPIWVS